jgi:hypothetical protein
MFEQSYINQAPAEPMYEGDFLYHYEIPSWQLGARIYQILGVSLFINLLILAIFAQTPVLTAKGCDGPLVGKVCQVLDTVYIGAMLFGTDRDFADYAYEKTDLGDVDVTFVDVSNAEAPLEYPPGYFQIANPEQQFGTMDQASLNNGFIAPGIPSNPTIITTPDLTNTPQVLPTPNSNAVEGTLPTFNDPNPTLPRNRRNPRLKTPDNTATASVNSNSNTNTNTSTNSNTQPIGPTDTSQLNGKPFKDLANRVNELRAKQPPINLQAPVEFNASARIDKDGRIAKGTFKYGKVTSSEPELVNIVKDAVSAFNDSNLLQYLQPISGERVDFSIVQNDTAIIAGVKSDLDSEEKANSAKGVIKLGIDFATRKKQDEITDLQNRIAGSNNPDEVAKLQQELRDTQDDLDLLANTTVETNGKTLNIGFSVKKDTLHQMINRKLDQQAAEMKKVNGNATGNSNENTAVK